jgi:hypothetical protein
MSPMNPNSPSRNVMKAAMMAAPIESWQAIRKPNSVSATWPPSSGRIGRRLNTPHQMLMNCSQYSTGHQLKNPRSLLIQRTSSWSPQLLWMAR